jgi:hypothetical protein
MTRKSYRDRIHVFLKHMEQWLTDGWLEFSQKNSKLSNI